MWVVLILKSKFLVAALERLMGLITEWLEGRKQLT